MELYCHKCVEVSPDTSFKLQDCDCQFTDHDYYATLSMDNCPCGDEGMSMCDNCANISYSKYKVDSDLITIKCKNCGLEEQSCCEGGYYKL